MSEQTVLRNHLAECSSVTADNAALNEDVFHGGKLDHTYSPQGGNMYTNAELSFTNVSDLTRDEKREIWMKRTGHTVSLLASIAGVVPNVLSRYLRSPDMPAIHHAALVAYGVPPEVLPEPAHRTPGRKRITPILQSA